MGKKSRKREKDLVRARMEGMKHAFQASIASIEQLLDTTMREFVNNDIDSPCGCEEMED